MMPCRVVSCHDAMPCVLCSFVKTYDDTQDSTLAVKKRKIEDVTETDESKPKKAKLALSTPTATTTSGNDDVAMTMSLLLLFLLMMMVL